MRLLNPNLFFAAWGLMLGGCDRADMVAQPKAQNWDQSQFFANQSSMRQPVAGTVPRDQPNRAVPEPEFITQALLERGQERYDIFCAPCHGRSGDGHGMIVERGFPAPQPLSSGDLGAAKAVDLYDVVSNGRGLMYGQASQIPPADRWAIIAYVRALQLSRNAKVAELPKKDQDELEHLP